MATFRSLLASTPLVMTPLPVNAVNGVRTGPAATSGNRLWFQTPGSPPNSLPEFRASHPAIAAFKIIFPVNLLLTSVVGLPNARHLKLGLALPQKPVDFKKSLNSGAK